MFSQYASLDYIRISRLITHNEVGWYTASLFDNRNHTGTPLWVQLNEEDAFFFSEYQKEDYCGNMISTMRRMPESFTPIAFSTLCSHTQQLVFRMFERCIADEETIIRSNDPWWDTIDDVTAQQVESDIRRLTGVVNGSPQYNFTHRFLWRNQNQRCAIISRCAIGLIHWDTIDPLPLITHAAPSSQTATDQHIISELCDPSPQPNIPRCPTCSSTNIRKLQLKEKAVGFALFGVFSQRAQKQFHCNNCGYEW